MAKLKVQFKNDSKLSKQENATLLMQVMNDEYGEGTVYTLGDKEENQSIPRWSTGIEDLDKIIGGGMPMGRVVEIFGAEGSGKTTLCYHLMAQCELALDIPIEGTFDIVRANLFGNHKGQMIVSRANVGEEALKQGYYYTTVGADIVVVDSVPSMITRKEFEEMDFEKEPQRGRIASLLSAKLPIITKKAEECGTTWIFVNQLRDEMGAMPFAPQTHTPGGRALKHYASLRIQVNRIEFIKIPNKYDTSNSAKDLIIGIIIKVKIVKSKVCNPLGEAELVCFFDRGFVSYNDFETVRKEHMKQHREKFKEKE